MSELSEEEIARAIARCVDEEKFYNSPGFQNADRAVLALLQPALERARREERERIAAWIEPQRSDVPAHGWEFAAAIRKG